METSPTRRDFVQQLSVSVLGGLMLPAPLFANPSQPMMTSSTKEAAPVASPAPTFTLKSDELGSQFLNAQYLNGMGYTGGNQSPQLSWEHAPSGTKSFAVTIYDLDAPTGSGFWHWVMFNIPPNVHELKADAGNLKNKLTPEGAIQSNTDFGGPGYGGIAPTPGPAHRYLITVYALSQKLDLNQSATPAYVGFSMAGVTLDRASLLVYGKKR